MFMEYMFGVVFFVLPIVGMLIMVVKTGIRNIIEDRLCEENLVEPSISMQDMQSKIKSRMSSTIRNKSRHAPILDSYKYEHMKDGIFTSKLVHIDCFKDIHRRVHINRLNGARCGVVDEVRKEYFHPRAGP